MHLQGQIKLMDIYYIGATTDGLASHKFHARAVMRCWKPWGWLHCPGLRTCDRRAIWYENDEEIVQKMLEKVICLSKCRSFCRSKWSLILVSEDITKGLDTAFLRGSSL